MRWWMLSVVLFAACSEVDPTTAPVLDGRTIAVTERAVLVADVDRDEIALFDLELKPIGSIAAGGEPTRIVRAGDRVFVSLRAERSLAVLRSSESGFALETKIATGAEPYGLAASPAGDRVYVAASLSHEIVEIDAVSLGVLRSWPLDHEPRFLAMHPSGRSLYVGSAILGIVSRIDLQSGEVADLPMRERTATNEPGAKKMVHRVSGDLAVSPDGRWLAVPLFYAVTDFSKDTEEQVETNYVSITRRVPGSVTQLPVVDQIELDAAGVPIEGASTSNERDKTFSTYVTSVTFDPGGGSMIVVLEGLNLLILRSFSHSERRRAGDPPLDATVPSTLAPSGVAIAGGRAFHTGFVGREVRSVVMPGGEGETVIAPLAPSPFPARVTKGRELFYSATDSRITGGALSCATCHVEGRSDGWTWHFAGENGPRQTPSLTEEVSARAPLRWEGDRAGVREDVMITSARMGANQATGASAGDAENVHGFIDSLRPVDLPLRGADDPAIARGAAIFWSKEVGCGSCHSGALLTDLNKHVVIREELKTPSLLGIFSSPPYLHDGSVPTLEALVRFSRGGKMGNTSMLTPAEEADLVAYLKSL